LSPVALLALPVVLRFGVPANRVTWLYIALFGTVAMSAWLNGSSSMQLLLFSRSLVASYLIYRLVDMYANAGTLPELLRACVALGALQVPLVALERLLYDYIPAARSGGIIYEDIGIGTFRDDPSLAFFLLMLVAFLLLSGHRSVVRRHRIATAWLSFGVMMTNADICKLALLLIWGMYLLSHLSVRTVLASVATAGALITALFAPGVGQAIQERTESRVVSIFTQSHDAKSYLKGNYARGAALVYYLNRDVLWFGDGPSRFTNVITKVRQRGNTGHAFTYYSEVGLIGWGLSALVFLAIAVPGRLTPMPLLNLAAFMSVQILSFTTEVLNHVGVFLIYCIIVNTYRLRPGKTQPAPAEMQPA
jgi:hypothetical protein